MHGRRLVIAILLLAAAMALAIAGVVTWRMTSMYPPAPRCPANSLCYDALPQYPYRLHPIRAELLWAAGAACLIAAVAISGGRRLGRPRPARPVID